MNPLRGPDVLGMVPIRFSFDSGTSREQTIDSHALRSDAYHRVSKDGPARSLVRAPWSVLRDAALRAAPQDEGGLGLTFPAGVGDNSLISLDFMEENGFGFRSVRLGFPSAWAWNSFSPVWNSFSPAWNSFREGRPRLPPVAIALPWRAPTGTRRANPAAGRRLARTDRGPRRSRSGGMRRRSLRRLAQPRGARPRARTGAAAAGGRAMARRLLR